MISILLPSKYLTYSLFILSIKKKFDKQFYEAYPPIHEASSGYTNMMKKTSPNSIAVSTIFLVDT